jgi:hypothetical protein
MTELQSKVLFYIKSGKTDEEKMKLALNAVSMWYMENGYFNRSYSIDAENPK